MAERLSAMLTNEITLNMLILLYFSLVYQKNPLIYRVLLHMLLHNLMIDMRCPNVFLRAAEWCRNDTPELISIDRIDKVISPKGLDREATLRVRKPQFQALVFPDHGRTFCDQMFEER